MREETYIDFLGALVALLLLSPIFIVTIILLHFANKGAGVFFSQPRPGKNEKIFNTLKFKTMTDEMDAEGNLLPDAERLTPVGEFVRSTSIDELPQLINILKMAIWFSLALVLCWCSTCHCIARSSTIDMM